MITFVVPMYNEEDCLKILYQRIIKACKSIKYDFEIIAVDDGSGDSTLKQLKKIRTKDKRLKIVSLARNFGHQIALSAGLRYASGKAVIVMDADLQDPPEIIGNMIKKWQEGYKVVYGVRKSRCEGAIKNFCYHSFYRLLLKISSLKTIPLDTGDFCLMDIQVVKELERFSEQQPFVRGLRTWVGFKQIGIEYDRPGRLAGRSKYNFFKLIQLALDGILSFSTVSLRLTTYAGLIISLLSFAYGFYIGVNRILIYINVIAVENLIPGWATLVCTVTFLLGLQFIFLGIQGEYIGRIYLESKKRPLYIVEEEIGFKK